MDQDEPIEDMLASAIPIMREGSNWEHLADELELLNISFLREVRRQAQDRAPGPLDYLHGLVLNEQEIVAILTDQPGGGHTVDDDKEEELSRSMRQVEERISDRRRAAGPGNKLPQAQLTSLFHLERIEEQCLVLCLAPEIDWKYSKVFAFLQDDVTKKQPSVDLALTLFCKDMEERLTARAIFSPDSSLLKYRLIHLGVSSDGLDTLQQRRLKLDDRIVSFLLEIPRLDECLGEWVELVAPSDEPLRTVVPSEIRDRTVRMVEDCFADGEAHARPVIHLYGREGSGRRSIAECVMRRTGLPLLVADVRKMPQAAADRAEALWRLGRESLLLRAAIFVEHFDDLLHEGRSGELAALLEAIQEFSPLTYLSGTKAWKMPKPAQLFLSFECPVPSSTARVGFWKEHLQDTSHMVGDSDLVELASKFNFTDGQIREVIEAARSRSLWESQPAQPLTLALLNRACRSVATQDLGSLGRKLEQSHAWSDLVLPKNQLDQLSELTSQVKRAQLVLETWGFAQKFPYGKGVTALFEGPSGTGKTMAAGIVGAELGLDLYKIDLSFVVSKYIGETEKNLNRIFTEAQDSNAILFFDEADALFGKRSEVKDAHDRYANIETAYLLQRMEDYSGIVILATNMKQHLDEAFVRRMRFIIHFPFPSDEYRQMIWEKAFPGDAPLGRDVDFRWLARKLKITGGHIKNISLRAAFLATERQGVIEMDCLVDAARRELEKMGKISTLADFQVSENQMVAFEAAEVA
ncbi:MAG TPA: ATP-binding protein [Pyrinomonadaceae bacterium]